MPNRPMAPSRILKSWNFEIINLGYIIAESWNFKILKFQNSEISKCASPYWLSRNFENSKFCNFRFGLYNSQKSTFQKSQHDIFKKGHIRNKTSNNTFSNFVSKNIFHLSKKGFPCSKKPTSFHFFPKSLPNDAPVIPESFGGRMESRSIHFESF